MDRTQATQIDRDIESLREPILTGLSLLTIGISWAWFAVLGMPQDSLPDWELIAPMLPVLFASIIAVLVRKAPLEWRSMLYLVGICSTLWLGHSLNRDQSWLDSQILVVGLAGLLMGPGSVFLFASLVTVYSVGSAVGVGPYDGRDILRLLGLVWALSIASWLATRNLYTALRWALDSQSSAWATANEARERRGELRRAVDSLETTHKLLQRTMRELRAAQHEAEEARRFKSRFVANISHELRTPLNVIVGFAEMLCTSPETYGDMVWPSALREDLLTIWRNSQHLLGMVDDVLDLAQIEAHQLPVLLEPTGIVQLIRSIVPLTRSLLDQSGIELRLALPEEEQLLEVDPTRIRQVLLNLINNAARFTPGGIIEVGGRVDGNAFTVYVRDTGVGIPRDKLETIFRDFEQVDSSMRRAHQGAGLGLAISRHFVALHGGHIWAESELGEGSTFYFTLPLPQNGASAPQSTLRQTHTRVPPPERSAIVVRCSDTRVARLVERHTAHCDVIVTDSIYDMEALIREHHPSAAMIATESPQQLHEAVAQARWLAECISPVRLPILVSSFPTEQRASALIDMGEVLLKPVIQQDIILAIRRVCPNPSVVLIADDEPDMLRLLERTVAQEWTHAKILTANSGQGAMRLVSELPDVILLDILMPDTNGLEVIKALRASPNTAAIPVVVITARVPAEALVAEATEAITVVKSGSFTAEELMHCLESLVDIMPPRYAAYT
jgi:signal transduction histidine kinase/CheY-like chemotaxis protein